jgi:hypothetical protein
MIFSGCATKGAITKSNYDELILEDIVQIITWFDTVQRFSSAVNRAQTIASVYLDTYPDEIEVVLAFLEISLDFAQDIRDIDLAIRAYTKIHNTYINNKTKTHGAVVYQSLTNITADIRYWYIKYPVWDTALNILINSMERRGFDHSVVP